MRSRRAPKRSRNAPLSLVERRPPIVARSGHKQSQASRWPCCTSVFWSACTVQPDWTVTVRSAHACSRTRLSRTVDKITSALFGGLPQSNFVPRPRGTTATPASFAQESSAANCSSFSGSATNCDGTPQTESPTAAARKFCEPTAARRFSSKELVFSMILETVPSVSHQNRSAIPADSRGWGTYSPAFSPHMRGVGKIFVGLES